MSKMVFFFSLIIFCKEAESQNDFQFVAFSGASLFGNTNALPTSLQFGGKASMSWNYTRRLIGVTELGFVRAQPKSSYLHHLDLRYFSLGCGVDLLPEANKLELRASLVFCQMSLYADNAALPEHVISLPDSKWKQWGVQAGGTYFFKPWLGADASFMTLFPRSKDRGNGHLFLQLGICVRWLRTKEKRVEKGIESTTP